MSGAVRVAAGIRRAGSRTRAWLAGADGRALGRVLVYLLVTRLCLFVVGAFAARIAPAPMEPRLATYLGRNLSVGTWIRWDAWWYVSVVERGYWFSPEGQSSVAFFPGLPLAMAALTPLTGNPVIAGLLVANAASLLAVVALWHWVRSELGPEAAERSALWVLAYPFSFVFHTIYAESLFFLFATLALLMASRGRWLAAGSWGALAAATRPMGVLLAPALALGVWVAWRRGQRPGLGVAGVALPAIGLGAYMAYLAVTVGDPLAFWAAHAAGWDVRPQWTLAGSWRGLYWLLTRPPRVKGYLQLLDSLRVVLPLLFLGLTARAWRRLGPVAGSYATLAVGVAVVFAPESAGRELLAAVPAFAVTGLRGPRGTLGEALRTLSMAIGWVLLFAFATGHFVG